MLDGAKKQSGMAPFRRFLTDADAEDVRAFWLWAAKSLAAAPPKAGAAPAPDHPH